MVSAGTNIQSLNEPLQKVSLQQVADALRNPVPAVAARLRQLRIVRSINPTQYAALKRQLPYFVCAHFNPPYRRTENFAYTESFVIDIDHLSDNGLILADLRRQLCADKRVMLCFASPSGDGLKVVFRLTERCYDPALYKTFYLLFAQRFSELYHLEQAIDTRTSDVARACFMSHDEEVYYCPTCEAVALTDYVDAEADIFQALSLKHQAEQQAQQQQAAAQPAPDEETHREPGPDIMAQIRQTLNPNGRRPKAKSNNAYVPPQLEAIMADLTAYITERGIEVTETLSINYGKKIRTRLASKLAETNVFFGKRGFSVVQSPRTGTDARLNELLAEVISSFLAEHGR